MGEGDVRDRWMLPYPPLVIHHLAHAKLCVSIPGSLCSQEPARPVPRAEQGRRVRDRMIPGAALIQ